jgi:hypothetical protein
MKGYMGVGIPSIAANQDHKPVHFYAKEKSKYCTDRYQIIEGYTLKQTIVKVLDSDNEEDIAEIEKNKKMLKNNQRNGMSVTNFNVKIKKRYKNLPWYFDRPDSPKSSPQKQDMYATGTKLRSPNKKRFGPNRFASNTLRYSQIVK